MTMPALDRVATLLEVYGANPDRWPAGERPGAQVVLASSAEARRLLAEAGRTDRLLDSVPAATVDTVRVDRVVAAVLAALPPPRHAARPWWQALLPGDLDLGGLLLSWPRAAGLAACAVAGVLAGAALDPGGAAPPGVAAVAFTPTTIESLLQ